MFFTYDEQRIDHRTSAAPLRAVKHEEEGLILFRMVSCHSLLPADLMEGGLEEVLVPMVAEAGRPHSSQAGRGERPALPRAAILAGTGKV